MKKIKEGETMTKQRRRRGLSKSMLGRISHSRAIHNREVVERLAGHATKIRDNGFDQKEFDEVVFLLRNAKRKKAISVELIVAVISRLRKDGKEAEARQVHETALLRQLEKLPAFEEITTG